MSLPFPARSRWTPLTTGLRGVRPDAPHLGQTSRADSYDVAHSSLLSGCGPNDGARVVYPPGSKVSDIASDLHLLAEKDPPT